LAPLLIVTALLQSGCVANTAVVGSNGVPMGAIHVTSTTIGNIPLTPTACASGERQLFLGADFLEGSRGTVLRLILQPSGESILRVASTTSPLNSSLAVHSTACSHALI